MSNASAQPSKHKIQIPFGKIDYTGVFKEPIIKSFAPPSALIENLFRTLKPFGFSIDGVETRSREKVKECAVEMRRTPPLVSFKVTPAEIAVSAENLDWSDKDKFLEVMNAALRSVLGHEHAELQSQMMVLAMHVQLEGKPRNEVTAPLLSETAYKLLHGEPEFQGVVVTRVGASVVVDASNVYANALFVRLVREHKADITLEQMATQLYEDEVHIFDVLNLEGDL
jgi:hypothetical protein